MGQLEKRAVLMLSTAHLTYETADYMDITPFDAWPFVGGNLPHGYYIYAHDEDAEGNIPPDLMACMRFANEAGCTYIHFDADVETIAELPSYEW